MPGAHRSALSILIARRDMWRRFQRIDLQTIILLLTAIPRNSFYQPIVPAGCPDGKQSFPLRYKLRFNFRSAQ